MVGLFLAAAGTALILLVGEKLWQNKTLKGESARKFIHIAAATYAAFWPYFVTRRDIALLSLVFILALIIIKRLKIFKSMRSVRRTTYGEIWYALSIGLLALVFKDNVIYTVAVLHMALADGFAAVVGISLAKNAKNFRFQGSRKSCAGTATFILVSFILNLSYWLLASRVSLSGSLLNVSPILYSILSAIMLSITEIVSTKGSDNVVVPFAAGILLWLPLAIF
jgi:phytol kinase